MDSKEATAKCPYFQESTDTEILCKCGTEEGLSIFKKAEKHRHEMKYCDDRYTKCVSYKWFRKNMIKS